MNRPADTMTASVPVHAVARGTPLFEPVRNPIDRSGGCFRVKFFSQKNRRLIKCESLLEAHVLRLLEFARDVASYSEQPPKLSIRISGRSRRYTSDFAMRWKDDAVWLVEVKPHEISLGEEMQERLEAARSAAVASGMGFLVLTDLHVGRPGWGYIDRLLECRRRVRTENLGVQEGDSAPVAGVGDEINGLIQALSSGGEMPAIEMLSLLGGRECGRQRLEALLASRAIAWRIEEPLLDTTLIHQFTESDDEQLFA